MQITIRYFAAARAAAGADSTVVDVTADTTLGDLETTLARDNPDLRSVLARCSYLRDSIALCDRTVALGACETIDVLPPFAGG
ncbi:MoaD/ThiS family protein [Gordonia rhizosphera]|uniref:Molybdopterin synthase small subunit MoaD n=1 Tax=Gordonia rhizosphera NBRC 16068 TaxID=1108045 RepID=K6W928_9ACTN|nr:MoaD/ThiS family protein [Gordonia rhizosphera]GAB88712.1 molybdopterin synthase small subunit MoaD [Gordonia rhizosphera NBRC 16068]